MEVVQKLMEERVGETPLSLETGGNRPFGPGGGNPSFIGNQSVGSQLGRFVNQSWTHLDEHFTPS